MSQHQHLGLQQQLGLRLTQQQLRYVRMLEYNAQEVEQAVEMELEDNPALGIAEEAEPPAAPVESQPRWWRQQQQGEAPVEYTQANPGESLYDSLLLQLSEKRLDAKVESAARFIIGSLDSNGYLRRPLHNLIDDMAFSEGLDVTPEQASEALDVVKGLDPAGIGADSLRECLLLQLRRLKPSPQRDIAIEIIDSNFDAFSKKHIHRLISALRHNETDIKKALALIRRLNPKPGSALSSDNEASNVIVPDFIVWPEGDELQITINNRIPELRIERSFTEAMADLEHLSRARRKGSEFIVSRYREARDFIKILSQRQQTMMAVMTAIVDIQKEYFLTDDVFRLKPMMIKDISSMTGLDISVVSRATNNKYVATPAGNFPLRFFFSDAKSEIPRGEGEGDGEEGDVLTNRKIEAEIRKIIEGEDKLHPLSDERIRQEMEHMGYDISRRTVAKYRDRLGIPVARLRRP